MEATLPEIESEREAGPLSQAAMDYARIERALHFLNANYLRWPSSNCP
jgi:hypothetical protein